MAPLETFTELVDSRREWIDQVLIPWCRRARRNHLLMAEQAWPDLAGRPDSKQTLWLWAWQRFPQLCEEGLTAMNETWPVRITVRDGTSFTGYPDARQSERGTLVLIGSNGAVSDPVSIDDILTVEQLRESET